jgi:integrase
MPGSTSTLIRKTWPKIRIVNIRGERFYQVDARKQGTDGKRETFSTKIEAEKRAAAIAQRQEEREIDEARYAKEGLTLPLKKRMMALECEDLLAKFGKSLLDATRFYVAHLDAEEARKNSATVDALAQQWCDFKRSGKQRQLRQDTLDDINETKKMLVKAFGPRRILAITAEDVQDYFDAMTAGPRRRFNVRNRFGQFFNWAIKYKHTTTNPTKAVEIAVPSKDPAILEVEDCKKLIELCQSEAHEDLLLYVAICLFAGLRPTECKLLTWEKVYLDERQITVLGSTSKVKETRNVPIEDNLWLWLHTHKGPRKGLITRNENMRPRLEKLRVAMGYKLGNENEEGKAWVEDVLRHTYASYWLGKNKDRGHLAENMGTSLKMIKQHYKRIVAKSATEAFWQIGPTR